MTLSPRFHHFWELLPHRLQLDVSIRLQAPAL
jgi:hypothetical protein